LIEVDENLLPPYHEIYRLIDPYGYISFNGNYFWIPEDEKYQGREFKALEYENKIEIYQKHNKLVQYDLPAWDTKNKRIFPPGCKPKGQPQNRKKGFSEEERALRSLDPLCGFYLDFIHSGLCRNRQKPKLIRDLYSLSKRLSLGVFTETLQQAMEFNVDSIHQLERVAQNLLQMDLFPEKEIHLSSNYQDRPEYRKGQFSSEADLGVYQDILDKRAGRQQVGCSPTNRTTGTCAEERVRMQPEEDNDE